MVTHMHERRRGVRYMTNGLKVYYLPLTPVIDGDAFPTFTAGFALFRQVLIRECVTIVHGHQATSTMTHECLLQARTMGYKVSARAIDAPPRLASLRVACSACTRTTRCLGSQTPRGASLALRECIFVSYVYFVARARACRWLAARNARVRSINLNKLMKFTLSDVDHAIAVSHTWCVCAPGAECVRGAEWGAGRGCLCAVRTTHGSELGGARSRENLVLRASLDPRNVSAIPNAVDPRNFTPDPSARLGAQSGARPRARRAAGVAPTRGVGARACADPQGVNIVMISRLVYRKGIDLAVFVIPEICRCFPRVKFIIGAAPRWGRREAAVRPDVCAPRVGSGAGGDGPKRLVLEEMREKHQLHERVELLGAVPHNRVRDVLVRGHIYLNTSLTEAFCIAIVEAARWVGHGRALPSVAVVRLHTDPDLPVVQLWFIRRQHSSRGRTGGAPARNDPVCGAQCVRGVGDVVACGCCCYFIFLGGACDGGGPVCTPWQPPGT